MLPRRLVATAGLCLALAATGMTPAIAASVSPATCVHQTYFNRNSNLYLRADASSPAMGLAYSGNTFNQTGGSANGFRYGHDVRPGGTSGWVRSANLSERTVC